MNNTNEVEIYTYSWFIDRFAKAKERALQFCQPISSERFVQRPAENRWSVGECYSHLNAFGEQYFKRMKKGLEEADSGTIAMESAPSRSFTPGLIVRGVIWLFEPPYKLKMSTVKPFHPEHTADLKKEEVLTNFLNMQDRFVRLLESAEADLVDLSDVRVPNPLLPFFKMTLSECFSVVEVHQRRHMWQAEQVLSKIGDRQLPGPTA